MSLCPDSVLRSFAAWRLSESAPKMKKRRAHVSEEHRLGSRPMIQNPSRQKELVRKRRAHIASEKNYSDIYIYIYIKSFYIFFNRVCVCPLLLKTMVSCTECSEQSLHGLVAERSWCLPTCFLGFKRLEVNLELIQTCR